MNWLQQHGAQCALASIVVAERFRGAFAVPFERRAESLKAAHKLVQENAERIIPFDAKAAEAWGEYVERPALKAHPKSYPDTQIAAIALSHDLIVVTRNVEDFPEVPTLNPFV